MKTVVWTLGNLEHKVFPNPETIEKFTKVVKELCPEFNHLVWGADLRVEAILDPEGS